MHISRLSSTWNVEYFDLKLIDPESAAKDRLGASITAAAFAAKAGAQVLRVHDVRATRQALDLQAVLSTPVGHAGGPEC